MGKSTISMAIFNSFLLVHQRVDETLKYPYKVVPPSYKLVYNPINYRYITYKP